MVDLLDRASGIEERQRELALKRQQSKKEKPLIIDGVRCCLNCEDIIPIARVKAVDAVRCITDQVLYEASQKHLRG